MFDMLRPGGKLIVANFVPNNHGRGYMEAFMDWNLICRDEAEMAALVDGLPGDQVACHSIYRDEYQNIVYLAVTRH